MEYESYLERAKEAKAAFHELVKKNLHRDAVSRAYYAAFYLAMAILVKHEVGLPKTHQGLLMRIYSLQKELKISKEFLKDFAKLQAVREKGDYSPIFFVEKEDIQRAKRIIAELERIIGENE